MLYTGESNPYPQCMTVNSALPICSISCDDSNPSPGFFFDIKYCIRLYMFLAKHHLHEVVVRSTYTLSSLDTICGTSLVCCCCTSSMLQKIKRSCIRLFSFWCKSEYQMIPRQLQVCQAPCKTSKVFVCVFFFGYLMQSQHFGYQYKFYADVYIYTGICYHLKKSENSASLT